MKTGKRDAEEVIEKQVVDNKKQKMVNGEMEHGTEENEFEMEVNGDMEQAAEENKFEMQTQNNIKEGQTNNSDENTFSRSEEEKNKIEVSLAINSATTTDEKRSSSSIESGKEDRDDNCKETDQHLETPIKSVEVSLAINSATTQVAKRSSSSIESGKGDEYDNCKETDMHLETPNKSVEVSLAINFATTQDAKSINNSIEPGKGDEDDNCKETNMHLETPNKSLQTPVTSPATGSKIVLMDNLSFSIKEADVRSFFKNVGEIAEVHFEMKNDYFTARGHIEFTTAEAAQEALKLNNELLLDQPVRLNLETERVEPDTTTHVTESKTLYLGNLSFSVEEDDVRDFFKDVGEIFEIRFAIRDDRFLGYGHIEFTTAEAAQEALKLNNKVILDRRVNLDLARPRERGAYTPNSSMEKFNQKGGQIHGKTIFIRGFDPSDGFDNIRSALENHFGKCGEISRMSIPKDYESGGPKGVAFIDFAESSGFSQALRLDGSEVGGNRITVEKAKNQRVDSHEGSAYSGSRGWSGSGSHRESSYGGGWRSRGSGSVSRWHRDSSSGAGWHGERASGIGFSGPSHRESGSSRGGIESGYSHDMGRESGFGRGGSWGSGNGSIGRWGRERGGSGRIGSSGGGSVIRWNTGSGSGGSGFRSFSSGRVGRFSGRS